MNDTEKLGMRTASIADGNFATLAKLFPDAVTETIVGYEPILDKDGKQVVGLDGIPKERAIVERSIDADVLAQEINTHVVRGKEERYQFTWPDKKKSILLANAPIAAALRPCREESVDFDTTENLYIEGDNLDVLKLLRETYLNRVKMIYIDPPYNTGSDLVYEDDFTEETVSFLHHDGQFDEQGNRLVPNLDSNGRFHTDWLNMLYPRLRVARDFLTDDGLIFISIDDGEVAQLRKICDELFGISNFIASIVWQKKTSPDARMNISPAHDYIIVYAKNAAQEKYLLNSLPYDEDRLNNYKNPDNDPRGVWASVDVTGQTGRAPKSQFYEITTPSGKKYFPPEGRCWALAESTFNELYADNRLWFGENGENRPRIKKFLSESEGMRPWTWWTNKFAGHNQEGNQELMKLFDGKLVFDNPKPTKLIKQIVTLATSKNEPCICLDFFSGSATLAQVVMEKNAEDGGRRQYICVQVPQSLSITGNDFKANNVAASLGYEAITDIGKERIRRAGKKIKEDNKDKPGIETLDTGFRVLKLDSSNMKDVYYTPEEYAQMNFALDGFMDNIKEDRTDEDLLFQVMLDLGIPLSAKIEQNNGAFYVNDNYLIAFFDKVNTDIITEIAKEKPYYAVFRDSSFLSDSALVNFEQVFNIYSPKTIRKVL